MSCCGMAKVKVECRASGCSPVVLSRAVWQVMQHHVGARGQLRTGFNSGSFTVLNRHGSLG